MAPKLIKASARLMAQTQAEPHEARGVCPQGQVRPESDGLAARYTGLADDAAASAKKREGSMLLSAAETQIAEAGETDEALRGATAALEIFRGISDAAGIADALRLQIHSHRARAHRASWQADGEATAQEAMKTAEDLAREELAKFQEQGDKRGEGAMSLAVAEASYLRSDTAPLPGDYKTRNEALEMATKARDLFVELDDKKLEAMAHLALARIEADRCHAEKSNAAAETAVKLFSGLDDKRKEGEALCALAQGRYMTAAFPEAHKAIKSAVKIFRETGPQRLLGHALLMQGQLCLSTDRPKEALPAAKEALELFQSTPSGLGYQAAAICMVSRAYGLSGEAAKAKATAEEGVKACEESGDKKGALLIKVALVDAALGADVFNDEGIEDAMAAAEDAVTTAREIGDKVWEAQMLHNRLMLQARSGETDAAMDTVAEADALLQELGDESEQARVLDTVALMQLKNEAYDEAAESRGKQRELYQKTGETLREAMTMLQTCVVYCAAPVSSDYLSKGMDAADEALTLCQEAGYQSGEAIALSCKAEIYLAGETPKDMDPDKARATALEAQQLFQDAGNRPSEAILMRTLANAHLAKKDTEEAINVITNAVALCKKSEDRRLMADCQMWFAQTLLDAAAIQCDGAKNPVKILKKAGGKALKAAKDALAQAKKLDDRAVIAQATYVVALVNTSVGNNDEALKGANLSVDLFAELGSKMGTAGATALVAEAWYGKGDNAKAEEVAAKALDLAQKCNDKVTENRVNDLLNTINPPMMYGDYFMGGGMDMMPASGGMPVAEEKKGMDPEHVRQIVNTTTLGALATDEEIHLDSPLMESGMDSLSSVAFRNTLNQQLQMNLPAALMFDYPSQRAIVDHVVEISKQ